MNPSKFAGIEVLPLEQLYLMALIQCLKAEKMDAVLQDFGDDKGRLWFVTPNTTVPLGSITFQFEMDGVKFGIITRDSRELVRSVRYAEGIDGFLEEAQKFFRAGRLAAPSKKAA